MSKKTDILRGSYKKNRGVQGVAFIKDSLFNLFHIERNYNKNAGNFD